MMGSMMKPHKLATIDLTKKKNVEPGGSSSWMARSSEVRSALEEYGCFIAVYDDELHDSLFYQLKDMFELPDETKAKNKDINPLSGYRSNSNLYQSFGIAYATTLEGLQSFTHLLWPNGNHAFSKTLHSFTKLAAELEQKVARMVFESYGLEKHYESHQQATSYICRTMKYNVSGKNENEEGLPPHTDNGFISVLHQMNQVNGLEVQAKDGQWFSVELGPSSYLVFAADAAKAWSNNRLHSPVHRVTIKGGLSEPRYSIAQFSYLEGKMTETPEELVDEDHPLQFKPFDNLKFFEFLKQKQHLNLPNLLELYCGIV